MHSPEAFVSMHAPIGGKRETKGNETGNEQETKRGFLYKTGNGPETRYGNEAGVFRRLRFLRVRAMRSCYRPPNPGDYPPENPIWCSLLLLLNPVSATPTAENRL